MHETLLRKILGAILLLCAIQLCVIVALHPGLALWLVFMIFPLLAAAMRYLSSDGRVQLPPVRGDRRASRAE